MDFLVAFLILVILTAVVEPRAVRVAGDRKLFGRFSVSSIVSGLLTGVAVVLVVALEIGFLTVVAAVVLGTFAGCALRDLVIAR